MSLSWLVDVIRDEWDASAARLDSSSGLLAFIL